MIDPAPTLDAAIAALERGELVGLPTETVYGLAADAANPAAVARVFALKRRPLGHPLIVHVGDASWLSRYAAEVTPLALRLAARFWPGPLTLVLARGFQVSLDITGGQDSVAIRAPAHPFAAALLARFGRALVAPSANRFGHVSPTTAAHVRAEFGDALPMVLDGGPCAIGIESTIVDARHARPRILRPGSIDIAAVADAAGVAVARSGTERPRVSGALAQHYAPRAEARLSAPGALADAMHRASAAGIRMRLLTRGRAVSANTGIALPEDPDGYGRGLYAALRALDATGCDLILIESPPDDPAWDAIRDRLDRATAR